METIIDVNINNKGNNDAPDSSISISTTNQEKDEKEWGDVWASSPQPSVLPSVPPIEYEVPQEENTLYNGFVQELVLVKAYLKDIRDGLSSPDSNIKINSNSSENSGLSPLKITRNTSTDIDTNTSVNTTTPDYNQFSPDTL